MRARGRVRGAPRREARVSEDPRAHTRAAPARAHAQLFERESPLRNARAGGWCPRRKRSTANSSPTTHRGWRASPPRQGRRRRAALKVAVGTAGRQAKTSNSHVAPKMEPLPLAIGGGDEGLQSKPTPAIFLEAARRHRHAPPGPSAASCVQDAPSASKRPAVAGPMRARGVCSTITAAGLAGAPT